MPILCTHVKRSERDRSWFRLLLFPKPLEVSSTGILMFVWLHYSHKFPLLSSAANPEPSSSRDVLACSYNKWQSSDTLWCAALTGVKLCKMIGWIYMSLLLTPALSDGPQYDPVTCTLNGGHFDTNLAHSCELLHSGDCYKYLRPFKVFLSDSNSSKQNIAMNENNWFYLQGRELYWSWCS